MVALFTAASFLSALLLFAVQPLATRMILPDFGGSAAVWTTSMLFFQTSLLLGYAYTHVATTRLRRDRQLWLHLGLLLVPLVVLPLSISAAPRGGTDTSTVVSLLGALAAGVGLPFLLVSTSGPLLQRWFSWTDHGRAHDPYFLYAAGNVGSILGLVSYPVVVEPLLDVEQQATWWAWGYALLLVGIVACVAVVRRRPVAECEVAEEVAEPPVGIPLAPADGPTTQAPSAPATPLRWVALAFVPSSLMLGVTTFLSTDIAAVPLLWVAPLATYLATFVLAFSRASEVATQAGRRALAPVTLMAALFVFIRGSLLVSVPLVLLSFAAFAMVFHGRLAARRPSPDRLTAFYVWVAVGGALGGLLNAVIAPLLLPGPFEFAAVAMVAAVAMGRSLDEVLGPPTSWRFWAGAGLVAACTVGVVLIVGGAELTTAGALLILAAAALFAVLSVGQTKLAWVGAVALLTLPTVSPYLTSSDVLARSFYGSYRVLTEGSGRSLYSGTTLHGQQDLSQGRQPVPTTYYAPTGPVGDWLPLSNPAGRIGAVGLGAGSLAAYVEEGQSIRFHEIDATVVDLARQHFGYLDSAAGEVDIVLGDGRLTLRAVPDEAYDLLVIDAFTSDSIPVHLLTEEAFALYDRVLADEGTLLVHISNRYLDLEPVVAAGGEAAGLTARIRRSPQGPGREASAWMALTRDEDAFSGIEDWTTPAGRVTWTDRYSNLFGVLQR